MLKFRSGLSSGLNAVRSFTTTQVAQEPLSKRVIEKLNKLGLPIPPENRPGRLLSAYNAFVRENLKTFKNQSDPTGTEGQAGLAKAFKACGEAWRELPASEKQKYLEPASKLRQEAREAYSAYLSQLTRKDFKRINEALPASARLVRPRGSSRPDGVRKPAGAFTLFCKDHTVKSGGPNMSQQTSELSVKWRAMSDEEKEPYLKAARDQRAAYKQKQEEAAGTTDGSSA